MNKSEKLNLIADKVCNCQKCPMLVENRNKTVFGSGNPDAKIVFMGEAPGQNEDKQGLPFVGRAGELLTNMIVACGLSREEVYILNALKCRPPNNRPPTPEESSNCRPFLELQLRVIKPKFIVCLGNSAAQSLLQMPVSISSIRGTWFDYKNDVVDAKVICTYHPAYLLRQPSAKSDSWNDMQKLIKAYQGQENPEK
jgi:DNA polymerase